MPIPPPEVEPSFGGTVSRILERRLLSVHTCLPARVERWDPGKGLVDAQPLVKAYRRRPDGQREAYSLSMATDVPVLFTGGGGGPGEGYRQTYPVQVGDLALLLCSEASLDKWLERGDEVDPEDDRRHHLSDGFAIVGLRPAVSPWTGISADATTWGKDGGLQIHITGANILLGGEAATDDGASAQKVLAQLNAIKTALTTFLVSNPAAAGSFIDGGVLFQAAMVAIFSGFPGGVAASNLKVKP